MGIRKNNETINGPLDFSYSGDSQERPVLKIYKNDIKVAELFGLDCYEMVATILRSANYRHISHIKEFISDLEKHDQANL